MAWAFCMTLGTLKIGAYSWYANMLSSNRDTQGEVLDTLD